MRHAIRAFVRQPGFSAIAIITIALGIGGNTAMFSVVDAVLLRPLPYADSERLVWVWTTDRTKDLRQFTSFPDFLDWRSQTQTLEHLAGWGGIQVILSGEGEPERLQAAATMGDLFTLLGVKPVLGTAVRDESASSQDRKVVLSHGLWQRRFGSDPNVLNRAITLSGQTYDIAAVMPADFQFPIQATPVDVWVMLASGQFNPALQQRRNARLIEVMGRLKPNVTLDQAQAEMDVIAANLRNRYPESNNNIGIRIVPGKEHIAGGVSRTLLILFGAVGCVLLIACVNVGNLLLARGAVRRREIAVRAALGAGRSRIARHLLTESLLLAAAGGIIGSLLAVWGVDALAGLVPGDLPRGNAITVDGRALGFTAMVSLLTGLLFGLAPAWHASKVDLVVSLHEAGRTASESRTGRRLRDLLVVAEIALALVLLAGAALFMNSFWRLNSTDPGFDPKNVLTFEVNWPSPKYSVPRGGQAFRELQTRLQAIPGVRAASVGMQLPERGAPILDRVLPSFEVEGRPVVPDERPRTSVVITQPGYFLATGIPLIRGRDFRDDDKPGAANVTIINESLARVYFSNEDPIGKRLTLDSWTFFGQRTQEIIAVAGDVKHQGLGDIQPLVYLPLSQAPRSVSHMVVKTDGDPLNVISAVRAAVRSMDTDQPIYDIQTLEARIGQSVARDRFSALLLGIFSSLALILAAVGLYGIVSYVIAQRTREMAIRMALGADRRDVLKLVIGQGMKPTITGIVIGIPAALALTRVIENQLFGVTPSDPASYIVVTVLLVVVALLACWIPARRATKVDTMTALRYQ
jgi:putative ABC transport system permease protein